MPTLTCHNPACLSEFKAKRSDAKYCRHACKMAHRRSIKKELENIEEAKRQREAPIRKEIAKLIEVNEALETVIAFKQTKQKKSKHPKPVPKPVNSKEQIKLEVEIYDWEKARRLNDLAFYNIILNEGITALMQYKGEIESWVDYMINADLPPDIQRQVNEHWILRFPPDLEDYYLGEVEAARAKIPGIIEMFKGKLRKLKGNAGRNGSASATPEAKLPELKEEFRYMRFMQLDALRKERDANANKIADLHKKLATLPEPEAQPIRQKPAHPRPKRKKRGKGKGYNPEEIRSMEFNLIDLSSQGDLGAFMGDLETGMLAMALIGDAGAGKSFFSYRLAKMFMNVGMSAKYFSIEEGITAKTTLKLDEAGVADTDPFEVVGTGTLNDVREAAKKWDVVLLDSWSVLEEKPEEYNKLRVDFPDTIFIVIFQKTTDGKIRGGSKIIFDTPICINVYLEGKQRLVHMKKTRYGTFNWIYSITDDEVIYSGESNDSDNNFEV